MNQFIAFPLFTLVALASAAVILRIKKPEQILLSASIISAPWSGGLWISFIQFDFRLTYVFLIGSLAISLGQSRKFNPKYSSTITIPIFLLIFWTAISASQAYDPAIAIGPGVLTYFFNFLYLFVIIRATKNEKDVDGLLKSLFIGLFITALIAILQYKIRFFYVGFIDRGFSTFMWWRPRATFHHPNAYGMYLLILMPILFREIINKLKLRQKMLGILYCALFLVSGFTFFTTSNRGSWVGFAFGIVLITLYDLVRKGGKKTRKIMLRVVMAITIMLVIGGIKYAPRIYSRMFEGREGVSNKAESRAEYNIDAYAQIKEHPILGVGVRNLQYYSRIIFTHNLYLLMLAEVGYPGFFFFIWYFFGFLIESWKGTKAKNFYVSNINLGFLTSFLALVIASFPGPDYAITPGVSAQLWILGGIGIILNSMYQKSLKIEQMKKRQLQVRQMQHEKLRAESKPGPSDMSGVEPPARTSSSELIQPLYNRSHNGGLKL